MKLRNFVFLAAIGTACAQTVTFDFDTGTPALSTGQLVPLDQSSAGVAAHFSSPSGPVFSVQTDAMSGLHLSQFSGKYLFANNQDRNILEIKFSRQLTAIRLAFATADLHQNEVPTTMQLTAYLGSNTAPAVGTASTHATYGTDTFPMGTLSFSAGQPFDLVDIVLPPQPLGVTAFFVDNIAVTLAAQSPSATSVSAATFLPGLAPGMFASAFGTGLASTTAAAQSTALPTVLGGVSVNVTDGAGATRPAPLIFVSPGQVNYVVPAGTQAGQATVAILNGSQTVSTETVTVGALAPGFFTANADGKGVPAAYTLNGQTAQMTFQCGQTAGSCATNPLDLGAPGDQVYLVLFGTGIRGRSSLGAVTAKIGGIDAAVSYAGDQLQYPGLDQVNVLLPRALAGLGEVDLVLTADGKPANTVRVNFK